MPFGVTTPFRVASVRATPLAGTTSATGGAVAAYAPAGARTTSAGSASANAVHHRGTRRGMRGAAPNVRGTLALQPRRAPYPGVESPPHPRRGRPRLGQVDHGVRVRGDRHRS